MVTYGALLWMVFLSRAANCVFKRRQRIYAPATVYRDVGLSCVGMLVSTNHLADETSTSCARLTRRQMFSYFRLVFNGVIGRIFVLIAFFRVLNVFYFKPGLAELLEVIIVLFFIIFTAC